MLVNLVLGIGTMILCLTLQVSLVVKAAHFYRHRETLLNDPSLWSSVLVVSGVMLLLVAGNLAQVAIWGLLFLGLGEFQEFSEAFYHSGVNFATLGYGDFVMSPDHKLLGPLEAINGVLMIGLSTAALMSAFQDALAKVKKARHL